MACDGWEICRRGRRQADGVLAFCLFGNKRIYVDGALHNVELAKSLYPGWQVVFYVGSHSTKPVDALLESGAEVRIYDEEKVRGHAALILRFCAADEAPIAVFRDADSRLNLREKGAVAEWLRSGRCFHIMHEAGHDRSRILGGMWGIRNGPLKMKEAFMHFMSSRDSVLRYGDDLTFLDTYVMPVLTPHNTMRHDPSSFPASPYLGFVGQPVNCVKLCTDWRVYAHAGCPHIRASKNIPSELSTVLRHQPDVLASIAAYAATD